MKVIKRILAGIGVLAALLCALIIISAVNPNITKTLSSLVTGNGFPSRKEESAQESAPVLDEYEWGTPGEGYAGPDEAGEDFNGDTDTESDSSEETSADEADDTAFLSGSSDDSYDRASSGNGNDNENVRGTSGYEAPSELDIKVPEAVNGKGGYQPITEKSEALPDAEGREYTSTLGYGETGDGLFF